MAAKALALLLCAAVALGCDCGACEEPSCRCERFLWTCRKKCLGDYYGKNCACNWQGTSTSETNIIIPDSMRGLLTVTPSADNSEVVLGGWSGLWVGTDRSGNSYRKVTPFDNKNVWTAAKAGSLIIAGGPTGIHRSTDNGQTAELVSQGLSAFGDNNFAAQGKILIEGDSVFAATFEGLFVSRSRGASGTWSRVCDATLQAAMPRSENCSGLARDLVKSADGKTLYATFERSAAIFAVDMATEAVSVVTDDASWCTNAGQPFAVCSTWTLAVFGDYLVIAPRPGPKVKAIKLTAVEQGWVDLQTPDTESDVAHVGVVAGKLYVQYVKTIYSYDSVSSAPQVVADTQNDSCLGLFNELRFNIPVLPMGGGFTLSPNGKYLVVGSGSGAYRVINN